MVSLRCCNVRITHNLLSSGWWESSMRYWFEKVGFLHTGMFLLLLSCTEQSKKKMALFRLNRMYPSFAVMCRCVIHISGCVSSFHWQVCHYGERWGSHGTVVLCFLPWPHSGLSPVCTSASSGSFFGFCHWTCPQIFPLKSTPPTASLLELDIGLFYLLLSPSPTSNPPPRILQTLPKLPIFLLLTTSLQFLQ